MVDGMYIRNVRVWIYSGSASYIHLCELDILGGRYIYSENTG